MRGTGGIIDGGGGGGGGGLINGRTGGIIDAGGGCGASGGRMDGGDGVGNTGGTRDGGAGVTGFGGMGTPPMFGGSGTSGTGGKNTPFSLQSSVRTANVPAEKTRVPSRFLVGRRKPSAVLADVAASQGAALDCCNSCAEQDVTEPSRPLASGGRWIRNPPPRSVMACCRKTVRPFPSWHRTATRVPETVFVVSEPEWTEPTTTADGGGRSCFRSWWAARWQWRQENTTNKRSSSCEVCILAMLVFIFP